MPLGDGDGLRLPLWWESSLSLSLCEGRGEDVRVGDFVGAAVRVRVAVGAEVRDDVRAVEAWPPERVGAAAALVVAGSSGSSAAGVRLMPVGEPSPEAASSGVGSLLDGPALGTRVSAEPIGPGGGTSSTRELTAAAAPPAASTAATVSAATAADLDT